jgi:hypothetical protein
VGLVYDPRGLLGVTTTRPGVPGVSQLVSESYEYNTTLTAIFSKTTVRIRFNAHIRSIVVLTGGKLIGIYFL